MDEDADDDDDDVDAAKMDERLKFLIVDAVDVFCEVAGMAVTTGWYALAKDAGRLPNREAPEEFGFEDDGLVDVEEDGMVDVED